MDCTLNDTVDEIPQANSMLGFGQIPLQACDGCLGRQRVWLGKLSKGLDLLLDGAEELVSVLDRNRLRTVIECAVKGAIPQRVRTPPGNCRSSR